VKGLKKNKITDRIKDVMAYMLCCIQEETNYGWDVCHMTATFLPLKLSVSGYITMLCNLLHIMTLNFCKCVKLLCTHTVYLL